MTFTHALLACLALGARPDGDGVARWRDADAATRATMLRLARSAFDAYVLRRDVIDPPERVPSLLRERAAVFVSTMRAGAPRCCMGTLVPTEADAAHEIVASAVAAAGRDRRFPPVRPAELRTLTLIVSIVTAPRPVAPEAVATLDPARDGLAVKYGGRWGVVLTGETSRTDRMLEWARIRAGAPPGAAVELFRLDVVRFMEGRATGDQ